MKLPVRQLLGLVAPLLLTLPAWGAPPHTEDPGLYREVRDLIEQRHYDQARDRLFDLREHPLYPYLEAELLKARMAKLSPQTIDQYLQEYRGQPVAEKLGRPWLRHLARKRKWDLFLSFYRPEFSSPSLRCHYASALVKAERPIAADKELQALWNSPYSLPKQCDSAIKSWIEEHPQREQLTWERAITATRAGQTSLARYLFKQLPEHRDLIALLRSPDKVAEIAPALPTDERHRALVATALTTLAKRDYLKADEVWPELHRQFRFNAEQQFAVRQQIARIMIARRDPQTSQWISRHDPTGKDEYLLEWRIKLALKQQQWQQVRFLISLLDEAAQNKPQWQYWRARADLSIDENQVDNALAQLQQLAGERDYYGFLAADFLQRDYNLRSVEQRFPALRGRLANLPAVQRARELWLAGEHYWAEREWAVTRAGKSPKELIALAELAQSWNWHHQAIFTTARAKQWDDLALRFPLAYPDQFGITASEQQLDLHWLYAIARKESAFSTQAISPVGARGVMQLMPTTAREVARDLRVKYRASKLLEGDWNIRLGGSYLKSLLDHFEGNRILATAAYNAGPAAIEKALERQQTELPYDIWIEVLPISETRDYIKGVLTYATIYSQLLGERGTLVAGNEMFIGPSTALELADATGNPEQDIIPAP